MLDVKIVVRLLVHVEVYILLEGLEFVVALAEVVSELTGDVEVVKILLEMVLALLKHVVLVAEHRLLAILVLGLVDIEMGVRLRLCCLLTWR